MGRMTIEEYRNAIERGDYGVTSAELSRLQDEMIAMSMRNSSTGATPAEIAVRANAIQAERSVNGGITDADLSHLGNRVRDLSAHEQAAVEQRQRSEALEAEVAAIAASPTESVTQLRNIIFGLRRTIQDMSDGRGVPFEFRRRLLIMQAYEGKLAAIEERERVARQRMTVQEAALRYAQQHSLAENLVPIVDPEHQSAYMRLLQARTERATELRGWRGTPAAQFYASDHPAWNGELAPYGTHPNPVPMAPSPSEIAEWVRNIQQLQVGRLPNPAQTAPTPAPTPPPAPNPLHSIKPIPRKIVMD